MNQCFISLKMFSNTLYCNLKLLLVFQTTVVLTRLESIWKVADKSENTTSLNKIHVWLEIVSYLSLRPSPMIEEIREHLLLILLYLLPHPPNKTKTHSLFHHGFLWVICAEPLLRPRVWWCYMKLLSRWESVMPQFDCSLDKL